MIFTPDQVINLQCWQRSPFAHPFTCANKGDGHHRNDGALVPTVRGWICQYCDYTQNWAHDFMLDTCLDEDGLFPALEPDFEAQPKREKP